MERTEIIRATCKVIDNRDLKNGLKHHGDKAYYMDKTDHVVMPERESFTNDEAYLSTLAHEFSHATGHKDRLYDL